MNLKENPSGLVFRDDYFLCEECCSNHSEEYIENWTKTVMNVSENGMPIALWLIHEQNKQKEMMARKQQKYSV